MPILHRQPFVVNLNWGGPDTVRRIICYLVGTGPNQEKNVTNGLFIIKARARPGTLTINGLPVQLAALGISIRDTTR
jgi:hypothetical protein